MKLLGIDPPYVAMAKHPWSIGYIRDFDKHIFYLDNTVITANFARLVVIGVDGYGAIEHTVMASKETRDRFGNIREFEVDAHGVPIIVVSKGRIQYVVKP